MYTEYPRLLSNMADDTESRIRRTISEAGLDEVLWIERPALVPYTAIELAGYYGLRIRTATDLSSFWELYNSKAHAAT